MKRKCSGSEIEGVGGSTKPQNSSKRKEKTDFDKWNSICGAIRDAANLTVEWVHHTYQLWKSCP